ncbi:MAG: carbohydrate ABC transporter permease [Candidatus Melainabacteria bacterium]|nr:carbohydrate ABC transporter permease [Candidatus Melainabacteria bacterium]
MKKHHHQTTDQQTRNPQRGSMVQWTVGGLLVLGALLMLLPFWTMLATSLADPVTILQQSRPVLLPWPLHWENYGRLFAQIPLARYLLNSVLVSVLTTLVHVLLCAMAAYALSRLRFSGQAVVQMLCLLTLMVPPQVNIVPLFFLMKTLHWVNTYWALVVPGLFGAFGVFLFRQWFNGLPHELEEAARLDGCNPWQIFWRVALPLSLPPLATLAIFVFIGSWNSFLWPLVVTHSETLRTLPVGIASLKESFRDTTDWPLLMAASTVSVVPVMLVFAIGQRYLMDGLMAGSLKE